MPPAAKATTKRGKENVAPPKATKAAKVAANDDELAGDDFDGELANALQSNSPAMDVEPVKEKPKVGRPPKAAKVAKPDASGEEEERGAPEAAETTGTGKKSDSVGSQVAISSDPADIRRQTTTRARRLRQAVRGALPPAIDRIRGSV